MVDPTFTDKFLVVKVKWSGKQERILGLRAYTFATLHPKTGAITNEWSYEAISSIELSHEDKTEFTINMPGLKKKVQLKMRFRFRAEVLQALARARASFAMERRSRNMNVLAKLTSFAAHVEVFVPDAADPGRIQCTLAECMLQVGVDAVYQTGGTADIFPYAEFTKIQCIDLALDDPTLLGIVAGDMVHIFHTSAPNDVVRAILDAALSHDVSVAINREKTASDIQAQHMQFAGFTDGGILCRYDVQIPILLEDGQSELYGRSFLLTDSVVCEMDDGNIVAFAQPLTKLFELVRHEDDSQAFDLEFVNGLRRTYLSIHREAILGHLLSCCEARGNLVPLTKTRTPRGDRMFLRRMLHAPAAVPSEAVQYQSMWLQRLVGGGDSKADSGKAKSPSIFQTLKVHRGSGSKPETGIPVGDMVAELNANVTIAGVSSKLKEDIGAAVSLLLGELPNHVMRTAQRDMSVVSSHLQALYRLVTHPNAAKVALDMLSRSEYMDAMAETLKRQQFHPTYWVLRLMARLLHNSERFLAQMARKVFLSHNGFATALLALFQPLHPSPHGDPQQNAVLVMRLTEVLDALMSFVVDGMAVDPLFNILLSHVSMHYFMLLRTLFHFPVTSTVESIVCILDHMVHSSVLNFTKTHEATLRDLGQDLAGDFYMESPERIIKQYYSFLMASTPDQDLRHRTHPVALRLRYRFKSQFLQRFMHLLDGDLDLAIDRLQIHAVKYEGSKATQKLGQVKSAIYVAPSGLIVWTTGHVNGTPGKRSMYDYGRIQGGIGLMAEDPCGLVLRISGRHRIVYSFERTEIFDLMQTLAGHLGIQLEITGILRNEQILTCRPSVASSQTQILLQFPVVRMSSHKSDATGKHKVFGFTADAVFECEETGDNLRMWRYSSIHAVTRLERHPTRFQLNFVSGKSIWFDADGREEIMTTLLDACMNHKDERGDMCIGMQVKPSELVMELLPRAVVGTDKEHAFYFGPQGMGVYYLSKIHDADTQGFVDAVEEFNANCSVSRHTRLRFESDAAWIPHVCKEMSNVLMLSCKTRDHRAIIAILQAFCWLQHAEQSVLDIPGISLLETLLAVFTTENESSIFWTIKLIHALSQDASGSPDGKSREAANKKRIFVNTRLVDHLLHAFEDELNPGYGPLTLLAVSSLFDSVFCTHRDSTNNAHFMELIGKFGKIYPRVLGILYSRPVIGTFEACVMIMKMVVENADAATRQAICDMALNGGLTLRHLYKGWYSPTHDQRFVNQFVASVFMTAHRPSFQLLHRLLPTGFLRMLAYPQTKKLMLEEYGDGMLPPKTGASDDDDPMATSTTFLSRASFHMDLPVDDNGDEEELCDAIDKFSGRLHARVIKFPNAIELEVASRHSHMPHNYKCETSRDLHLVSHLLLHGFALPDAIWNATTRRELKYALEEAILEHEEEVAHPLKHFSAMPFAWNHASFKVEYASLAKEIKVGPYFLRILIDNVHDGIVLCEPSSSRTRAQSFVDIDLDLAAHGNYKTVVAHAINDISAAPKVFFDKCFQRWLQELPFCTVTPYGSASMVGVDSDSLVVPSTQLDRAEIWCLQLMVATYRAFPTMGPIEMEKIQYVVRMLRGETRAHIIEYLLAWLSTVALNRDTCQYILAKDNVDLFLDMSTLIHENTPVATSDVKTMKKSARSSQWITNTPKSIDGDGAPPKSGFSYFNFFKQSVRAGMDETELDEGETNIDAVEETFTGEVYWYVMKDNDMSSVSGPHPESILQAICSTKTSNWSRILLSMYNERAPEEREWRPLLRVPRVRWRLFVQAPFHVNVCIYTTTLVRALVECEMDRTSSGLQYFPVPAGKRFLGDPISLSNVVQLLLCNEGAIVESAIAILHRLVAMNDATASNLYQCGAIWFMFASASRVSFVEHALVLAQTHRRQKDIAGRHSILEGLLPEALIRILDLEGPHVFADVFTRRTTDGRVIWLQEMREHLQLMLHEHLSPFVARLHQDSTAQFEYSPMPPVIYLQLRDDIYVYNMYLSRLFPEDPDDDDVHDHVSHARAVRAQDATEPNEHAYGDYDDDGYDEFHDGDGYDDGYDDGDGYDARADDEHPDEPVTSPEPKRVNVADEVTDPLGFMRALHLTWREQIAVAESRMTKTAARALLKVDPSEVTFETEGAFLRGRYRAICRADENVDLARLNEAFLVLSCAPESDCELDKLPHKTLSLLLRTQLLFYDTFQSTFQSIPYESYDLLLKLLARFDLRVDIELPPASLESDGPIMELLSLTMELLLATMISSPWNVEQMLRAGGLPTIIEIADLCRKYQDGWVSEADSNFDYIGGLAFRVLLAVANTDVGREELAFEDAVETKKPSIRPVVQIVCDLITMDLLHPNMTILGLDILSFMARHETSQKTILEASSVLWQCLQLLLLYGPQPAKQQVVWAALRCVRALAGYDAECTAQVNVQSALATLLPIWSKPALVQGDPEHILSLVFGETHEPQCIWNDAMRSEVVQYLDTILEFPAHAYDAIQSASEFEFETLIGEPVVGGVYLRIYNEPIVDKSLPSSVALEFCESLLVFLHEHANPQDELYAETLLALDCFRHLTLAHPTQVQKCVLESFSEPPLIHAIGLYLTQDPMAGGVPLSEGSVGIDVDAVQRRDAAMACMETLAEHCDAQVLSALEPFCQPMLNLAEQYAGDETADFSLGCLQALCSASADICIGLLESHVWLQLLSMTIQARHFYTEDAHMAAETLRAAAAPVWGAILNFSDDMEAMAVENLRHFLPFALVSTLMDDPENFEAVFEEDAHDAELIWNEDMRRALRGHMDEVLTRIEGTTDVHEKYLSFPEDGMDFNAWDHGTIVGDLYLDLFLQNPEASTLRFPVHVASQLHNVWRHQLQQIIPKAAQSMMDAPYTLPDLVDRGVEFAGLFNKLTNALVFILREYSDAKAHLEDEELMAQNLLDVLAQCQAERAVGFPQTCVLRLMAVFANSPLFESPECLRSLFAPIQRKHQDPTLILEILRVIVENHYKKPKRQRRFSVFQCITDLDVFPILLAFNDGSADMSMVRRPMDCTTHANAIMRCICAESEEMQQRMHTPHVTHAPTHAVVEAPTNLPMVSPLRRPKALSMPQAPHVHVPNRASMPSLPTPRQFQPPVAKHTTLPPPLYKSPPQEKAPPVYQPPPVQTPSPVQRRTARQFVPQYMSPQLPQRQAPPQPQPPAKPQPPILAHPYMRNQHSVYHRSMPAPAPRRKTMSEVSIDTHSVSTGVDSNPRRPTAYNGSQETYELDALSMISGSEGYTDDNVPQDSEFEFEVDDQSEAEDGHRQEEYDI